jgi:hypothetical protein
LVIALRPQTPKHIRGGWSHYIDTSEPVDGNGAENMVTVQSGFEPATFGSLAHDLTDCSNRAHAQHVRHLFSFRKYTATRYNGVRELAERGSELSMYKILRKSRAFLAFILVV